MDEELTREEIEQIEMDTQHEVEEEAIEMGEKISLDFIKLE